MAYKTTSKNISKNISQTKTKNTNGSFSNTTSIKSGNTRTSYTQKSNGQSYTTVTRRFGDGSIERRRIISYTPKGAKSTRKKDSTGGAGLLIVLVALGFIFSLF